MLTDYYCDASFKFRGISSGSLTDNSAEGWRSATVEWFSLGKHSAGTEVQFGVACSKDCVNTVVKTDSLPSEEICPGKVAETRKEVLYLLLSVYSRLSIDVSFGRQTNISQLSSLIN